MGLSWSLAFFTVAVYFKVWIKYKSREAILHEIKISAKEGNVICFFLFTSFACSKESSSALRSLPLEPENNNLHIIKNMLLKIVSAEYSILELKMQAVDAASCNVYLVNQR